MVTNSASPILPTIGLVQPALEAGCKEISFNYHRNRGKHYPKRVWLQLFRSCLYCPLGKATFLQKLGHGVNEAVQENPCTVKSVGKGTVWLSGLGASLDSSTMRAEHVEGWLEMGAESFGNDIVHNIKPGHLGGGDGGINGADMV